VIRASQLTLRRGVKVLLDQADFVVHPGERVGLVGKNGAGKTSLFALIQGELDADAGTLTMPPDWRIATVAQEFDHSLDRPAREFVMDGDAPLRALQAQQTALEDNASMNAAAGQRMAEVQAALSDVQAWSAPARAEQLLAGLGFAPDQWTRPVAAFSGGWRMRIALARALMAPSDLLLLDEPTNHLDLDAMLWLERWLTAYPGTVMVISHDTEFLDGVVRTILHIDHGKLRQYRGNYSAFLTQRAEQLRQTRLAWERQQRETARLQGFIDRFRYKATKARQAQSRMKALARMQTLAPLHAESEIQIRLPSPANMPDPLLTLDAVSTGYQTNNNGATRNGAHRTTDPVTDDGVTPVLRDITLMIRGGSRIGILGVNGAGKSTLIKTLAGELPTLSGTRHAARGLEVGYFAQHQLDVLDPQATPLQHLAHIAPQTREQELRDYLGGFGFGGDAVMHKVAPMSGGEKARLALALIVWRKPNLLLLDEPSNHLDVQTRAALQTALAEFDGSVLLVSHDRHLLRTTVDDFWIVADGRVTPFEGDLDDYRQWLTQRRTAQRPGVATEAPQDRKAQRREDAQQRQRLSARRKPVEQRLAQVESHMQGLQARLDVLNAQIADPTLYEDARRDMRQSILEEHGQAQKTLGELEEQWLECQETLEALEKSAMS